MLSKSEMARRTRLEKYPLPKNVDGICALLRQILNGGSVRRVEIDVDDVVRAYRMLEPSEFEEPAVDTESVLRNIPQFVEYTSTRQPGR